jgi:hypothetical protein
MNNPVDLFAKRLASAPGRPFERLEWRQYAGMTFLYFLPAEEILRRRLEEFLNREAAKFTENTELRHEFGYVRTSRHGVVYRFRLLVPDEKSFCCGNLCPDCIRFRNH